ncbi:MAG: hypothetical protein HYY18_05665 [Planctomycetes bacterium]|nr:hypothetical protein [Planctomycetota bacterium]
MKRSQAPAQHIDPNGDAARALEAAERAIAEALPHLGALSRLSAQLGQGLEAALASLSAASAALRAAPPALTPPPVPPEAFVPPRRVTSPFDETTAMAPFTPPAALDETAAAEEEGDEVRFLCEKCGRKLSAPRKFAGRKAGCKCGEKTTIPGKSTRDRGKKD